MTFQQALAHARRALAGAALPDVEVESQVLVMHAAALSRTDLFTRLHELCPESAARALDRALQRRLSREPLAYITGHREFFGLDFLVDRGALIPRQETETLVERAIEIARGNLAQGNIASKVVGSSCRANASSPLVEEEGKERGSHHPLPTPLPSREGGFRGDLEGPFRIADVGVGCGAVAVSLAAALPGAQVYATDTSPAALELAAENCRRHGVHERVTLLRGDLLDPVRCAVDMVVANLPYIPEGEWEGLQPEIRLFEPREALLSGKNGLDHVLRLLEQVRRLEMRPRWLLLELGQGQPAVVAHEAARHFPEAAAQPFRDLGGLERGLVLTGLAPAVAGPLVVSLSNHEPRLSTGSGRAG